jgi:multidrug transporter EmrE-like cation transporter
MKLELEQPKVFSRATRLVNVPAIALILGSVFLSSAGQLSFKAGLNDIGELQPTLDMAIQLITNPIILLGLAFYAVSALLWLVALMEADLSFAYPFLSLNYVAIMIGGTLLYDERILPLRLFSVGLIILGLLTIARSEER